MQKQYLVVLTYYYNALDNQYISHVPKSNSVPNDTGEREHNFLKFSIQMKKFQNGDWFSLFGQNISDLEILYKISKYSNKLFVNFDKTVDKRWTMVTQKKYEVK